MNKRNIIVIGASAGGFEAIQSLVASLPRELPASVFIVWHMSPEIRGVLPYVLNKLDTLPAANAYDGEVFKEGRIYVAPPDRHMIIEDDHIRITKGPKENRFRPAVDPLFRSAAYTYGPRVIGIILSGALDDGTAGLWMVKHFGGISIVQHPEDAVVTSMPESAIRQVEIDYKLPVSEMSLVLEQLVYEYIPSTQKHMAMSMEDQKKIEQEIRVAKGDKTAGEEIKKLADLSPYTCPECKGVLFVLRDGGLNRYRCHTGHAYSSDSLLSSITEVNDDNLWVVIRGMEESIMMLNNTGDHHAELNDPKLAAQYFRKARETSERVQVLKDMVATTEQLSRGQIEEAEP